MPQPPDRPDHEALRRGLRSLYRAPDVPAEVDDAILARARRELCGAPTAATGPTISWGLGRAVALAASILLVVAVLAVWWVARRPASPDDTLTADARAAEDLDGNGVVDIRDAFLLARELEAGEPVASDRDFDGNGLVDCADVDHVAAVAVALES